MVEPASSSLFAASLTPFLLVLSTCAIKFILKQRTRWSVLHAFRLSIAVLELLSALFSFGYGILTGIQPGPGVHCRVILLGLWTLRTAHLVTVTSWLVDRVLVLKWSDVYRSSVNVNEVSTHIVAVVIVSLFLGLASTFAHSTPGCTLHPIDWAFSFSVCTLLLHALLILIALVSCLLIRYKNSQINWTVSQSADEGENHKSWEVVPIVGLMSILINHGPFTVLSMVGLVDPSFWTPWVDVTLVWLKMLQTSLVLIAILLFDAFHRKARQNLHLLKAGPIYRHLQDNRRTHTQSRDRATPNDYASLFPQRLLWSPTQRLPSLQSLEPLDLDPMVRDDDTLRSLPLSQLSHRPGSPVSTGSSLTTNAVNDFVFRRPTVMELFKTPEEEEEHPRCLSPIPPHDLYMHFRKPDRDQCTCYRKQGPDVQFRNIYPKLDGIHEIFRHPEYGKHNEESSNFYASDSFTCYQNPRPNVKYFDIEVGSLRTPSRMSDNHEIYRNPDDVKQNGSSNSHVTASFTYRQNSRSDVEFMDTEVGSLSSSFRMSNNHESTRHADDVKQNGSSNCHDSDNFTCNPNLCPDDNFIDIEAGSLHPPSRIVNIQEITKHHNDSMQNGLTNCYASDRCICLQPYEISLDIESNNLRSPSSIANSQEMFEHSDDGEENGLSICHCPDRSVCFKKQPNYVPLSIEANAPCQFSQMANSQEITRHLDEGQNGSSNCHGTHYPKLIHDLSGDIKANAVDNLPSSKMANYHEISRHLEYLKPSPLSNVVKKTRRKNLVKNRKKTDEELTQSILNALCVVIEQFASTKARPSSKKIPLKKFVSSSSDTDSVQKVVICQKVDRSGRVVSSDINRVKKKVFRYGTRLKTGRGKGDKIMSSKCR